MFGSLTNKKEKEYLGDAKHRPFMKRREMHLMGIAFVAVVIIVYAVLELFNQAEVAKNIGSPKDNVDLRYENNRPDLSKTPDILDTAFDGKKEMLSNVLKYPAQEKLFIRGITPLSLLWFEHKFAIDSKQKPVPQRFDNESILRNSVPTRAYLSVSATLYDTYQKEYKSELYTWMTLAVEDNQYFLALKKGDVSNLDIGEPVRILGRFAGSIDSPGDEKNKISVVVSKEIASSKNSEEITDLLNIGIKKRVGETAELPPEKEIFRNINDITPVLETHGYYYLLGRNLLVDSYNDYTYPDEEIQDAVKNSEVIRLDPEKYRGKPFTISGYVTETWEDYDVKKDKPYGIESVRRILMWNKNFEFYEEKKEGKTREEARQFREFVTHGYELAVIGKNVAPPILGHKIEATGRFYKCHGIPVDVDKQLDRANGLHRHSKNAYFSFFVVDSYKDVQPPPPDFTILNWCISIVTASFFTVLLYLAKSQSNSIEKAAELLKERNAKKIERRKRGK